MSTFIIQLSIVYQSFAMKVKADVLHCCIIVILFVQFSLGEGCNKGIIGGRPITPPKV